MTNRTRTIEWNDPMLTANGAHGKTGLEFLQALIEGKIPPPPICATLDFTLIHVEEGLARFEGHPAEFQYNPIGVVHGGFATTLLDSAMGCAVMSTLDANSAYTTTQISINLTRAITAQTGPIVAESRVVHRGRSVATAEGTLKDAQGRLLAHATSTCMLMPRRAP
jgi:uncharacterized protein (TIGR00369 family)